MANPVGDLGPCQALYGGIDLGKNIEIKLTHSDDTAEIKTAQDGSAPVDEVFTGRRVQVECVMTQTSLAALNVITPGSVLASYNLQVSNNVGATQRDSCDVLILKPQVGDIASTDEDDWLTVFQCYPNPDYEIVYDVDSQRNFKVIFKAYPVRTNDEGVTGSIAGRIYDIGFDHP